MSTYVDRAVTGLTPAQELNKEDLFLVSQKMDGYYESRSTNLCALENSTYSYVTSTISIDIDKILSSGDNIIVKISGDLYDLSDLVLSRYTLSDSIAEVLSSKGTDITYVQTDNKYYIKCDERLIGSGIDAYPLLVSCDGDSIVSEFDPTSQDYQKSYLRVNEDWLSGKCPIKGHMEQESEVIPQGFEIEQIKVESNGDLKVQIRAKESQEIAGGGVLDGLLARSGEPVSIPIESNTQKVEYTVENDCYLGIELSVHGNTNDSTKTQIFLQTADGKEMTFLNSIDAQQVFDNIEYINYQVPGFPVKREVKVIIKREDNSVFPYHIDYPSSITFREYHLKGCLTEDALENYIKTEDFSFSKTLSGEIVDNVTHYNEVISEICFAKDASSKYITKYIKQRKLSDATAKRSGLMSPSDFTKLQGIEEGATKFSLSKADEDNLGGIKTGFVQTNDNYPVKLNEDGKAYVTVPAVSQSEVVNIIYPVNSIFITLDTRNPSDILGIGTWTLVSKGRCLWGCEDTSQAGNTIEAGLPVLSGETGSNKLGTDEPFTNTDSPYYKGGALYLSNKTSYGVSATASSSAGYDRINFDASRCNKIYGNSETVQPPAFKVNIWRRDS